MFTYFQPVVSSYIPVLIYSTARAWLWPAGALVHSAFIPPKELTTNASSLTGFLHVRIVSIQILLMKFLKTHYFAF